MAGPDRALGGRRAGPRRTAAALLLAATVGALHLWLLDRGAEFGWGDTAGGAGAPPARIDVAYVRELAVSAEAPVVAAPPRLVRPAQAAPAVRRRPVPVPAAASAPASGVVAEDAPEPALAAAPIEQAEPAEPAASTSLPPDPPPTAAVDTASAAPAAEPAAAAAREAASAASASAASVDAAGPDATAVAVTWPPSTRLAYRLNGNYRGELQGSASVEWRVSGTRYQVDLQAVVGLAIAPLMSRRIRSDGEITDAGLAPRRFDGEQRVGFGGRRWSIRFEPDRIVAGDGPGAASAATAPGVQDEASQFVQLTWLFTTQPQLLQVGRTVELPLVLRRRVDRWVYDVVAEQMLDLPFGRVRTLHVKPRRPARGGDMTAEMWIAPGLQNLPVRILIRQDADTFVDLLLDGAPRQAEPGVQAGVGASAAAPR